MTAHEWELDALCLNDPDPERWFCKSPRDAIRVCFACPVRSQCLEDALRFEREHEVEPKGVRGAMTAPARRRILEGAS